MSLNRRHWLQSLAGVFAASRFPASPAVSASAPTAASAAPQPLQLADFEPRSMLHVSETKGPRARYPVVDIHTHLSHKAHQINGVSIGEEMTSPATPEGVLSLMDHKNLRAMVNLT